MYSTDEQITWRCAASGKARSYLVKVLDRTLTSFDLVIYQGSRLEKTQQLQTIQIAIVENTPQGLKGVGRTEDGETISAIAFKKSLDFEVKHSLFGDATGRCERNITLN
ncbi:MAG: hypothetical protein MUD14_29745 [Hydrococcus sp. Prado102]|jgi:hypothetical protein|nr:hypothetical protein [Hydrococcus sp. Prado102]